MSAPVTLPVLELQATRPTRVREGARAQRAAAALNDVAGSLTTPQRQLAVVYSIAPWLTSCQFEQFSPFMR